MQTGFALLFARHASYNHVEDNSDRFSISRTEVSSPFDKSAPLGRDNCFSELPPLSDRNASLFCPIDTSLPAGSIGESVIVLDSSGSHDDDGNDAPVILVMFRGVVVMVVVVETLE
ncbi:hypothetical protein EAG_13494 [Camponotus floridanus]|uniref:Uncharacterized protein n=1 Tax=Camponotus floridanus TaxID=104421 RepID=E2AC26_CAMFO|nr:hypothetical protein EAG_13494 [Camponotus floridanus]